jgi:hypothetical protein
MVSLKRMIPFVILLTGCGVLPDSGLTHSTSSTGEASSSPSQSDSQEGLLLEELPFRTLAQGESFVAETDRPSRVLVKNRREAGRLLKLVNDKQAAERTRHVDFDADLIVALFRGKMGSSGHGISVRKVYTTPASVQLTVDLPNPSAMAASVIAYPYHVILMPRQVADDRKAWVVYTSDGRLFLEKKAIR